MQRAWKRNEEGASEGEEEEEETRECSHKKLKEEEETEVNTKLKNIHLQYLAWRVFSLLRVFTDNTRPSGTDSGIDKSLNNCSF